MDKDFTGFLAGKGFTEPEYLALSPDKRVPLVTAFEKSKEGNCRNCFTEDFRIIYSVDVFLRKFRHNLPTISYYNQSPEHPSTYYYRSTSDLLSAITPNFTTPPVN